MTNPAPGRRVVALRLAAIAVATVSRSQGVKSTQYEDTMHWGRYHYSDLSVCLTVSYIFIGQDKKRQDRPEQDRTKPYHTRFNIRYHATSYTKVIVTVRLRLAQGKKERSQERSDGRNEAKKGAKERSIPRKERRKERYQGRNEGNQEKRCRQSSAR